MLKFTNFHVLSLEQNKIWAPAQPDMIPYYDMGYHGGVYWAHQDATRELFEQEEHFNILTALGWEEVETYLELPLRQIMTREYDGFSDGKFYWLIKPPANNNPLRRLSDDLAFLELLRHYWTDERAVRLSAGHMIWATSSVQNSWWTRVTITFHNGLKQSYGFNQMKETADGNIRYHSQGWGRYVRYRSIPTQAANVIFDADYRMLNLFDGNMGDTIANFTSAKAEYMGGVDGLEVIYALEVTRAKAVEEINSKPDVIQVQRNINKLATYLRPKLSQSWTQELIEWSKKTDYYSEARSHAIAAIAAIEEGTAVIVPCTYDECNMAGYNAVAIPNWKVIDKDDTVYHATEWSVLFAPFSSNAPGRVGVGSGDIHSWMVIRVWKYSFYN